MILMPIARCGSCSAAITCARRPYLDLHTVHTRPFIGLISKVQCSLTCYIETSHYPREVRAFPTPISTLSLIDNLLAVPGPTALFDIKDAETFLLEHGSER